jgi:hypothetical protein
MTERTDIKKSRLDKAANELVRAAWAEAANSPEDHRLVKAYALAFSAVPIASIRVLSEDDTEDAMPALCSAIVQQMWAVLDGLKATEVAGLETPDVIDNEVRRCVTIWLSGINRATELFRPNRGTMQ